MSPLVRKFALVGLASAQWMSGSGPLATVPGWLPWDAVVASQGVLVPPAGTVALAVQPAKPPSKSSENSVVGVDPAPHVNAGSPGANFGPKPHWPVGSWRSPTAVTAALT